MSRPAWDVVGHFRDIADLWRAMTMQQRLETVAAAALLAMVILAARETRVSARMEILREQFHLPGDVAVSEFHDGGTKTRRPQIEGVANFTEAQYRAYEHSLDDPDVWRPTPLRYGGAALDGDYASDALRWRDHPLAGRPAYDPLVEWGELSQGRADAIENGRHFCFAVVREPAPGGELERDGAPGYRALACPEVRIGGEYLVRVAGALDPATRTLHMIVR